MKKLIVALLLGISANFIYAQEKVDLDMVNKIRKEGLENSKVMDIAFWLTDVSGPRLTISPGYRVPADEVRFHILRLAMIVIAGVLAAISFARGKKR